MSTSQYVMDLTDERRSALLVEPHSLWWGVPVHPNLLPPAYTWASLHATVSTEAGPPEVIESIRREAEGRAVFLLDYQVQS